MVLFRRLQAHQGVGSLLVCDPERSRLSIINSEFPNIPTTCSIDDVVSDPDIDAGIIATPVGTHGMLAKQLLEQQKHVLVEKPLAIRSSMATALVKLAEKQKRILMVAHTPLFSAVAEQMPFLITKQLKSDRFYLRMRRINSTKGDPQTAGSLLWDLAVHDLALFLAWESLSADGIIVESTSWQTTPPKLILILRSKRFIVEVVVGNEAERERLIRIEADGAAIEWKDDEKVNLTL
ncbi:MAG: Gfo/Idh/MocA family oxidoreductase, partial [Myxococcota bacterium]